MACTNPSLKTTTQNDGGRGSVTLATSGSDEGHFEVAEEPNMASLKILAELPTCSILSCIIQWLPSTLEHKR